MTDVPVTTVLGIPIVTDGAMVTDVPVSANLPVVDDADSDLMLTVEIFHRLLSSCEINPFQL